VINSIGQKPTRILRFVKMFLQSPKVMANETAKYFILKLPPFARRQLAPIERNITQNLRGFLVKDIVKNFSVTEKFINLYMPSQTPLDWSKSNWKEFAAGLAPLGRMYVEFALTTVVRGRDMVSLLESHSYIRRKDRYLDIGTGYGGFLRAFRDAGFNEVIGIELNQNLANYAQANIDGLQNAQVLTGDFVKDDFSSLGSFDVITCNDVIEHVDDPALAIQRMSALVNDDGCLFLKVPNKDHIAFVKSDGHFKIFGLTQLLKNNAADYYAACLGKEKTEYYYQMGEMYQLDFYVRQLSGNGLSAIVVDTPADISIDDVAHSMDDLKQAYAAWQQEKKPDLNQEIAQKVVIAVENYMNELELAYYKITDDASKKQFSDRYLQSFWNIVAFRHPFD